MDFTLLIFRPTTLLLTMLILSGTSFSSHSESLSLSSLSDIPELRSKQGYLLIDLDINQTKPSLKLKRLTRNTDYLEQYNPQENTQRKHTLRIENNINGMHVVALAKGIYQITQLNVPYFNLPYRLDTDNKRQWRFRIEEGKINYIGKLSIAKERSTSNIDAKLINRLASDMQHINDTVSLFPEKLSLGSGMGYRDDFLDSLLTEE